MRTLLILLFSAAVTLDSLADGPAPAPDEQTAANIAKAIAEARKAQADADLATMKLRFGTEVPAAYSGAVTANANAGAVEAHILAGEAVSGAARAIVGRVKAKGVAPVVLIASSDALRFDSLIGFGVSRRVFEEAYADAKRALEELMRLPPMPGKTDAPPPPKAAGPGAIALSLDAMNKILGFFRSEYTIAGMDIGYEDSILLHAVAGELSASSLPATVPFLFNRPAIDMAGNPVFEALRSISEKRADIPVRIALLERMNSDLEEQLKGATDARKNALVQRQAKVKEVLDKWKAAGALFDSQFGKLGVPDEKGVVPVATLVKEAAINDALSGGSRLLIVKTQKSGGSYFTKKNMWTSLGAMPFFVAGGTVASFVLLDGKAGHVLDAGVVPIHGGYHRVDEIEGSFRPPPKPARP
jgi:hypothetical protein